MGTADVDVAPLLEQAIANATREGVLSDAQIRTSPFIQELALLDEAAYSRLVVEVFDRIGRIATRVVAQHDDALAWLELHEHAEFRWCTVIADELLSRQVQVQGSQWTRVLSHIARFGMLLGFGHHPYLRPLETRLEEAVERGVVGPSAAQPLLEIAKSLEAAQNRVATEFALCLRMLARKASSRRGDSTASAAECALVVVDPTPNALASSPMDQFLKRWLRDSMPRHDSSWGLAHLKGSPLAVELELLPLNQREELAHLAMRLIDRLARASQTVSAGRAQGLADIQGRAAWSLIDRLLRRAGNLGPPVLEAVLLWMAQVDWAPWITKPIESNLLALLERRRDCQPDSEAAKAFLAAIIHRWGAEHKPNHKRIARAKELLGEGLTLELEPGEAWSDAAIADVRALPASLQNAWIALVAHCKEASSGSPGAKWAKRAAELAAPIEEDRIAGRLAVWFPLVDRPRTREHMPRHAWEPDRTHLIIDGHMNILRGLCWIAGTIQNPDLARALGRLALSCYRKVPGLGPRAVKVGNAAVYALGQMPGMDAVGQLAMLRVKVKFGTAQKGIEKALAAAAAREGLPREEIDELGVPSYGLTEVGVRVEELGEFEARLEVTGIGSTALTFVRREAKDGRKVQKSVPVAVKKDFPEELKELKAAARDIAAMLPAQRDRIDSLFLENKSWAFDVWRQRYLDHPLVGVIARRLIWRIGDAGDERHPWRSVMWAPLAKDAAGDGQDAPPTTARPSARRTELVDVDGRRVDVDRSAVVRLWHPIEVARDEVLAWRRFVEERQIRQPFKQAHREVYLLTDAERATRTYSNRFAAHILRQHQFNALCSARGWKNKLRLLVDDEYPPAMRALPAWGLRAEYWIEGVGDDWGSDTNEAGAFFYLATDQVRFYSRDAAQASAHAGGGGYGAVWGQTDMEHGLPLDQIPLLVFSEIMRDVDLFVGVASVASNPQWSDGGPGGTHRNYWWEMSFGDLSETGAGRKELLMRLLPRLKLASVCSLDGKFLRVRGQLRTYKIHLGSGNILMEPDDQYLCIVPTSRDAAGSGSVFLPFEGDRTLAIILSKAFMLAQDDKIKDASILSQIRRSV